MNLLLLSIDPAAVPAFLDDCVPQGGRRLRLGYVADAAVGMPFAAQERAAIAAFGYDVVDILARATDARGFDEVLDAVDAVYVAGGETFVLLEALRSNGTGDVLVERVRRGLPYIGCSAGSIIAGPSVEPAELMDSREAAPGLRGDNGLGLIDEVVVPHADGLLPPYPTELIERMLATYVPRYQMLPLRDDQAYRVHGEARAIVPSG